MRSLTTTLAISAAFLPSLCSAAPIISAAGIPFPTAPTPTTGIPFPINDTAPDLPAGIPFPTDPPASAIAPECHPRSTTPIRARTTRDVEPEDNVEEREVTLPRYHRLPSPLPTPPLLSHPTPPQIPGPIGIGLYTAPGIDGLAFYTDAVRYNINYSAPHISKRFLGVLVTHRGLARWQAAGGLWFGDQLDLGTYLGEGDDPCERFVYSGGAVEGAYSRWDTQPVSCFRLWRNLPVV
ncbi:hypothetical protein MMC30_003310 [Trapelia coarctata]|nr:hypothetical protein [Trapelia coarctata]